MKVEHCYSELENGARPEGICHIIAFVMQNLLYMDISFVTNYWKLLHSVSTPPSPARRISGKL